MKLSAILLILLLCLPVCADDVDVLVMIDVSASMDPYFEDLVAYLRSDLLPARVLDGRTVHLMRFSSLPEVEEPERVRSEADRERIYTKIALLEPIGLYTDLVSAVKKLVDYAAGLPEDRPREIYLLTDGIHDPPPGSLYDTDSEQILAELLRDARTIKKEGWAIHILQMPLGGPEGLQGEPAGEAAASGERPDGPGPVSYLPRFAEEADTEIIPHPAEWDEAEPAEPAESPESAEPAKSAESPESEVSGGSEVSAAGGPAAGEAAAGEAAGRTRGKWLRVLLYVLIGLLCAVLLGVFLYVLLRRRRIDSRMGEILESPKAVSRRRPRGELVEMRVQGQNTRIGFRNIHRIKRNRRKTVGGGRSDFVIFLVPFPRHIAEIHYDGERYRFSPTKSEYFPEQKGDVADCLGKDIRARSKRGYDVVLQFRRYVSPLEEINRILTLTIQHIFFSSR